MSNPFDTILGANRGANQATTVRPFQRGENVVVGKGHKLAGAVGVVKAVEGDIIGVMLRRATELVAFEKSEISRVERADQEAEFKLTEDVSAPAGSEKHKMKVQTPTLVTTEDGMLAFVFGEDEAATDGETSKDDAKVVSLDKAKGESRLNGDAATDEETSSEDASSEDASSETDDGE